MNFHSVPSTLLMMILNMVEEQIRRRSPFVFNASVCTVGGRYFWRAGGHAPQRHFASCWDWRDSISYVPVVPWNAQSERWLNSFLHISRHTLDENNVIFKTNSHTYLWRAFAHEAFLNSQLIWMCTQYAFVHVVTGWWVPWTELERLHVLPNADWNYPALFCGEKCFISPSIGDNRDNNRAYFFSKRYSVMHTHTHAHMYIVH